MDVATKLGHHHLLMVDGALPQHMLGSTHGAQAQCGVMHANVLIHAQAAPQSLHEAAKVGDEATLKRLVEEGQEVNAKDRRGITALGVAVGFNRIPCVRCLLDAGADVHLTDARGSTVLHYAAGLSL